MTTTRRVLALTTLTLALVLGTGVAANATFDTTRTLPQSSVQTMKVAPPTNLAVSAPCTVTTTRYTTSTTRAADGTVVSGPTTSAPSYSYAATSTPVTSNSSTTAPPTLNDDGTTTTVTTTESQRTSMAPRVTWTASTTTRGVTGYVLSVPNMGQGPMSFQVGNVTTFSTDPLWIDQNYTIPVSAVTTTAYRWTSTATTVFFRTCV
ncbi:hypothetical protein GCU56_22680 [Geodermatophilus sabuli]|uniref:Ig-like domain-containing protein n=1 Tax=Geodermatophilus sabuli TaxID=1564158 RepID=A0A7K3W747_9ACTN|nr:hypothetical protein [Geodermatophilus sabuli]NEK60666.1 hypothetical protein [Geodermatophilus sabuli]